MSRLEKWQKLSRNEKAIFLKASLYLIVISTGLKFLSFQTFRRIFARWLITDIKQEADNQEVAIICWAIKSAAYHLPLSLLCLPQSLTAKSLLRKDPTIRVPIGVLLKDNGQLEAHAWVERNGEVILGELPDKQFQPIWEWQ